MSKKIFSLLIFLFPSSKLLGLVRTCLNAYSRLVVSSFLLACSGLTAHAQLPGQRDGRVLLPNGWWISPAGESIPLDDFPLNAAVSTDQKFLAVTHAGVSKPVVLLVDLKSRKVVQSIQLKDSWLGIAFRKNKLFVSGGNQNCVYTMDLINGKLASSDTVDFRSSKWAAGLDVNRDNLAVVFRGDSTLRYFHLSTKEFQSVKLDGMPYSCKFMTNGTLLVSIWSSKRIEAFNGTRLLYHVVTGDHPTEIAIGKESRYAYVANANDNSVTAIDLKTHRAVSNVSTALYPDSPEGSTTNSVCATNDGKYVLAANADNNSLAIIDVSDVKAPKPIGFIPVGWYPTKVLELKDGTVLVLNGKGNRSLANPQHQYIGTLLKGTLSFLEFPNAKQISAYTKQVYGNTPYRPAESKEATFASGNPIPQKVGEKSPIKYVFYFIKENRTYDQVFGDVPEGNGDSSLVLFGGKITPNIHEMAKNFVLLDNLYCDAEVSADGHNWSTAAYATDYVEKSWPNNYGGRGAPYEFEGGQPAATPKSGYVWDLCARNGVSFRDYGEFVENTTADTMENIASEEILLPHYDKAYRGWDLSYSDVNRFEEWRRDFGKLVDSGNVPHFNIIRLPNDHTAGTARGALTPQAMVAQNDYALGLFVDEISHSKIWKQSAIFVIEDDAQNGADHVDAHRTEGLVIGPFVKRHFVDHTLYSTSSMLRTMELLLGLPPMSQYDAAANPMFNSFTMSLDTASYNVAQPLIDITAKNKSGAYGENIMEHMNLKVADAVPDRLFNEIIWRSIKGSDMPTPRYSILSAVVNK
ncbi:MAG TPA: alkaline phosphatase family protein [Candidatus Acidoferrales bacterium]|nr:alkaline phosphatase family protein [Candidatus Acidoferrales bacterium]